MLVFFVFFLNKCRAGEGKKITSFGFLCFKKARLERFADRRRVNQGRKACISDPGLGDSQIPTAFKRNESENTKTLQLAWE
jgi:hypothetical protein